MDKYIPHPIDTTNVHLSEDVISLCEQMAKNTHEVWSAGRLAQGWSYGECRDDEKKLHPCLIPYEQLSEEEKEFDRNTAMETLKAIVAMGYEIHPKRREA
jgi:ryanodine receptor 2